MPELGFIANGKTIGKKFSGLMMWHACIDCGKQRWVALYNGEPTHTRCHPCAQSHRKRENNPAWTGGIHNYKGYIYVYLPEHDYYSRMLPKNSCYIREHRLVMAQHLKRCLLPWEVVHHKNGIKTDNRIDNLQLLPSAHHHVSDTLLKHYVKKLEQRIDYLESCLDGHYVDDY